MRELPRIGGMHVDGEAQRCVRPDDWLNTVHREYLTSFVREGGAVVKFIVPVEEDSRVAVHSGLASLAATEGFVFASVDAAATKVHLIDKVFGAIAAQVPWKALAHSFVGELLEDNRLALPPEPCEFSLATVARLNEREPLLLRQEISRWLERSLWRDSRMCQEFRFAMIRMCMGELYPDEPPSQDVIEQWLHGELRLISALKAALIFQKIGRHNARHMLLSLLHWLRAAGKSGLVLAVDISRYVVEKRPPEPDGSLYYSRPATLDAYEVLRQLIDGTDDMEGCLIAVLASPDFLGNERRGLPAYDALNLRISDEVHDRRLANPLSSLVRISDRAWPLCLSTGRDLA